MLILQQAAVTVRLATATKAQLNRWFPQGTPYIPYLLSDCDNQVSTCWDRALSARGIPGQNLVAVSSELHRTQRLRAESRYLPGGLNVVADDISRNDFSLPFSVRTAQLIAKHPSLGTWDYFQPSPELLLLLSSRLSSGPVQGPCVLPTALGQFVPAGSITLSSPVI